MKLQGLRRSGAVGGVVLFALALLLGGGSLRFPLTRLIVELAASGVLIWYALRGWRAPVDRWSAAAIILLLLIVLLPLVQIIPLPPSIWTTLPGHEDAASIMIAAGLAPQWMPLHASPAQRVLYGWVVVAMALVGALLGLLQAGGSESFYIYDTGRFTAVTGLFANKNHHADLLLIAILLTAALTTTGQKLGLRSPSRLVAAGVIIIFALAVPAANSRMGLLLLPVAILPAAALLLPRTYYHRLSLRSAAITTAGLAMLVFVGARSGVVTRLLNRFEGDPDARLKFWPDVLSAIDHYKPFGSGLGSFIKIFQRHESMGTLHFTYVFHAHNDVMEIALEAGWAGIGLIILGVALWLIGSWRVLQPSAWNAFTPVHVACFFGITVLAAHSLVDYPLRTLGLACVLAFLAGCLAPTDKAGG
ncbi:MAG: O-antigen ligase domain-containing protein [Oxalobacteraceae bacterium]|nr:MAG: O-antigen ligase domain-containing protein [Oxalobacteraceae bacterium]